jgi:hypothetical protein
MEECLFKLINLGLGIPLPALFAKLLDKRMCH